MAISSPSAYQFPVDLPRYARTRKAGATKDADTLLSFIRKASEGKNSAGGLWDYMEMRPVFCAASVLLNETKRFPPRMRDTRKLEPVAPGATLSPELRHLSNDRQVIDLHWLHCTGQGAPEARWAGLLGGDTFDFEMAADFVTRVGAGNNKAIALGLTQSEEMQLAVIQHRASADLWRGIVAGRQRTVSLVRAAKGTKSRLPDESASLMPDAYVALKIADKSPAGASASLLYFTGLTRSPDKLRACRDWLIKAGMLTVR